MKLCRITFKNGIPIHKYKEVQLTTSQFALLKGKGEGSSVLIKEEHLKFKSNEDRKNNKQNSPRSVPVKGGS